eukprot:gene54246-6148_t
MADVVFSNSVTDGGRATAAWSTPSTNSPPSIRKGGALLDYAVRRAGAEGLSMHPVDLAAVPRCVDYDRTHELGLWLVTAR